MRFKLLLCAAGILVLFLAACSSLVTPPTPTLSTLEIQGRSIYDSYCSRCHSTNTDTIIVGPSLAGIAERGDHRIEGMDSAAYIRFSITNPGGYTVEGFPEGQMPSSLKDELSEEDLDALIAYLLTLR